MKKKSIFSVLLVMLVLGVTLFAATTLADTEPKPTLKVWTEKTDEAILDEEVDFYFTFDGFTDLGCAQFDVAASDGLELIDSEVLSGLGATEGNYFFEDGTYCAVQTNISGVDQPIDVLRLTFKVVGGGEQTVEAVNSDFVDSTMINPLDVEITNAAISVYTPCEHQWIADEDGHTDATCTEPGKQSYTCELCGAKDTKVIDEEPALGHDLQVEIVQLYPCQEGTEVTTCTRCDFREEKPIAPTAEHDYKVVVDEAKCEEAGLKTFTCANCGDTYTETIPALGHDFDEGIVTTEPGCETEGVLTCTCQREGCEGTKTEVIKALGHEDKDGDKLCDRCGADMSEPEPTPVDPQEEPKADTPGTGIAGESSVAAVVALLGAALCIGGVLILKKRSAR